MQSQKKSLDKAPTPSQSLPLISIIVRCYNDVEFIKQTLQEILSQEGINKLFSIELIVADNESTDGSLEHIQSFEEVKLIQIPKSSYKPGPVLNQCIRESNGDIIVFNNSDCIPQNKLWLSELVKPIIAKTHKITFARQLPRPNAWPLVQKDNNFVFPELAQDFSFFVFSLASCACDKTIWEARPFNEELQYSEDIEWGYFHTQKGEQILYCPKALVEHSHNYDETELQKRFLNEGKAEFCIFEEDYFNKYKGSYFWPSLMSKLLKDFLYLVRKGHFSWLIKGIFYRIRQQLSLRKGYLTERNMNK